MKIRISTKNITIFFYSLLFTFVVGVWYWEIVQFMEFQNIYWEPKERYHVDSIIYSVKVTNLFTASILASMVAVGIFLKNRIGWLLISGWFYFLVINMIKLFIEEGFDNDSTFANLILLGSIPIIILIIMNKYTGVLNYHKLEGRKKIVLNLLALMIGVFLVVFRIFKSSLLQELI